MRLLLTQLTDLIRSYTTARETNTGKLEELIALVADLVEKVTVLAASQGVTSAEMSQLVEKVKIQSAAFAGLRALIANRDKGVGDTVKALREATGSHPLQSQEPEIRVVKWGFIKRLAQQSGPRILFFLVHFALASFGASKGLQQIIDTLLATAPGRP